MPSRDVTLPRPSSDDAPPAPDALTRVTRVALVLNAVLHGAASVGMALGLDPHAAGQPNMAHRAAAAGVAAAFMLAFVGRRLERDPSLILLAATFVACNLVDSVYEFLAGGDALNLAPAVPEAIFLSLYLLFMRRLRRPDSAAPGRRPPR